MTFFSFVTLMVVLLVADVAMIVWVMISMIQANRKYPHEKTIQRVGDDANQV